MKKAVRIKDIALKLNMSVSTVSKALNDDRSISDLTKERVKKLAHDWNYIPNEAARHFKLCKTFTVGLIIPNMLDEFYVLAINGAEKVAVTEKYNVIISQSHENPVTEEQIVDLMKRNRIDGLLVAITKQTLDMSPFQKLENIGIPVVFFARPPKDESFDYVIGDNEDGAFKATEFLIKKGHSRIAHLMGPDSMAASHKRLNGYKAALKKSKIVFDSELIKVTDLTEESTFSSMKELMEIKSPPTAIFTFKNYISLDAIEYLKNKFPSKFKTIDFTGFGNLPLFRYLDHKPLASIEENARQIGAAAIELLFRKINLRESEKTKKPTHIKIACQLVTHK